MGTWNFKSSVRVIGSESRYTSCSPRLQKLMGLLAPFRSRGKVKKHRGASESQNEYAYGKVSSGSSSTLQFPDLDMGEFDSMNLLHASDSSDPSNYRNQRQGSTMSWPNLDDTGSQSPSPPTPGIRAEPPLGASLEERLGYVMNCARIAEFEDIDSVIMAYYTEKFDEGSACSTAQRFSRKRTLPKLLEKLQNEARSWRSWEAQPYRDEILNSAESLYLAEMRSFSARQGDEFLAALFSTPSRDWNCVHRKLQDEVCGYSALQLGHRASKLTEQTGAESMVVGHETVSRGGP